MGGERALEEEHEGEEMRLSGEREIERKVRSLAVGDKCFWKSVKLMCVSVCRSTSFCDVETTSFRQQVHHIIELA